jgi:hypothetical protein
VQGGIFSSFIGYDSFYAKDNFNYTRPWGADFTPYLMLGVNASYPVSDRLTGTFVVVTGYWHLADANHVPSVGGQAAYKLTDKDTFKETVLFGPHQVDTAGTPTALWMSAQLPMHFAVRGPWSVSVRPEVAWDRDGRWTLAKQTVKALTTTVEYRVPYKSLTTILRGGIASTIRAVPRADSSRVRSSPRAWWA